MKPILCYLVPVEQDAHPEHPIAPGGPPPGIWGPTDPFPGYGLPGGGRPPGYWGGGVEPMPTPPIYFPPVVPGDRPEVWPKPGRPVHPIVLPPDPPPTIWPDPPGNPPGGSTGSPSNPIALPPVLAASTHGFWALTYFSEMGGWLWAWVPVDVKKPAK